MKLISVHYDSEEGEPRVLLQPASTEELRQLIDLAQGDLQEQSASTPATHSAPNNGGKSRAPRSAEKHRCADCGLDFPTGSGLGGHRKVHRSAGRGPGDSGSPRGAGSTGGRKLTLQRIAEIAGAKTGKGLTSGERALRKAVLEQAKLEDPRSRSSTRGSLYSFRGLSWERKEAAIMAALRQVPARPRRPSEPVDISPRLAGSASPRSGSHGSPAASSRPAPYTASTGSALTSEGAEA